MSSAAYLKGRRHASIGKTLQWGINYFKDEPNALEDWVCGWCSVAKKNQLQYLEGPFVEHTNERFAAAELRIATLWGWLADYLIKWRWSNDYKYAAKIANQCEIQIIGRILCSESFN